MLMAADLPTSKQVFINGFIGVDGQKMSKSIGNVIAPSEMVERYGVDGSRYLLLTKGNFGEDNDISWDKMDAKYNADLANGLGNLVSRIIVLAGDIPISNTLKYTISPISGTQGEKINKQNIFEDANLEISEYMNRMDLKQVLQEMVFLRVQFSNMEIEKREPWKLKKDNPDEFIATMEVLLNELELIAKMLEAFLPDTSKQILEALENRERVILFKRIG
jgi:methionyl-tRNA synthetase